MRAGLECDDERRPSSPVTGTRQRHRFGVPVTVFRMPPLAYDFTIPEHHRTNQGVRLDPPPTSPGQVKGARHRFTLVHFRKARPIVEDTEYAGPGEL